MTTHVQNKANVQAWVPEATAQEFAAILDVMGKKRSAILAALIEQYVEQQPERVRELAAQLIRERGQRNQPSHHQVTLQ